MRIAPHALTAVAAISVALLAGRVYQPAKAEEAPPLTQNQISALADQAFAAAGTPAGLTTPEAIPVQIRRGETFEQAVRRTGIAPEEASAVAATLSNAMDVTSMRAGQRFETAISQPRGGRGNPRLIGLTMRTGPATQLTVSRSFDGALRLRALEEKVTHETVVLTGKVEGSLSRTARREGAPADVARAAGRLFSHKFDMDR
ncbi:MAG TPA: M23 family peptidase, partial [Brevundimonas sp.]|nr:M23 family peptidase [Brevundimonas sp.]